MKDYFKYRYKKQIEINLKEKTHLTILGNSSDFFINSLLFNNDEINIFVGDKELNNETLQTIRKRMCVVLNKHLNVFVGETVKDEIAFIYAISDLTQRQLAEMYGISKSRIGQIIKEVGWTDIGEWTDDKGKKHKPSDAPRYKSLGNSIGLPFWFWLTKRISAEYPDRKPTMTSLFAGIGGFDLCWHWVNGDGTVSTVAEIEPFPCAVLEKHFGENGDWKNYEKPEWYKKYESNAE